MVAICVGAANAAPVTVHVQINIRGPWSPDQETMFRERLGIQVLSTLPPDVTRGSSGLLSHSGDRVTSCRETSTLAAAVEYDTFSLSGRTSNIRG